MLVRLSYRSIAILIAGFVVFTFLTAWSKSPKNVHLHPSIPKTAGIFSASRHGPAKPTPEIKKFWVKWSRIFYDSRPTIDPIVVHHPASTEGSDKANGERQPSSHTLDLKEEVISSLKNSHKALLHDRGGLYGEEFKEKAKGLFSSTGIVTVAGGQYFAPAIVSIRMLRRVSDLPVQVFIGDHMDYEPEICEHLLPALNAECFAVSDFLAQDSVDVTHFQLKALAILFSSFESVLWLDSDCFTVRDPLEILNAEPFKSTGLVTWPDYWKATEDPVFYDIAGMPSFPPGMPARSTESGELAISKEKHLSSLLLACYYNVYGPQYYYPILSQGATGEGEKETFLAAAVVLGLPYYRVKEHVGTLGYFTAEGNFKGGAMVQYHPVDDLVVHNGTWATEEDSGALRPFFLHAHSPKLNFARMLDEHTLTSPAGKAIRLWGDKQGTEKKFSGRDIEKEVWQEMKDITCALEHLMKDWRGKKKLCMRVKEHYGELFSQGSYLSGIM